MNNFKTILFTNSDDRYLELQNNLLLSMEEVDFPTRTIETRIVEGSYGVFGSLNFNQTVMKKLGLVCEYLKQGNTVLFVDVDIVFLENPLPKMLDQLETGAHAAFQNGGLGDLSNVNTGFFIVSPTEEAVSLFDVSNWKPSDTSIRDIDDQEYINMKLASSAGKTFPHATLPLEQFPTGNYWFSGKADKQPTIVHYNFIKGVDSKIKKMKQYGHWFSK